MKVLRNRSYAFVLLTFLVLIVSEPAWAQESGGAPTPPKTVDLRVEDQPLLVLLERIARQCDVGLVAHANVLGTLEDEVSIYAKDAKWSDALDLLRREYGVELRLGAKRIEVVDADADFRERLVRRYYPTSPITKAITDFPAPQLGSRWDSLEGSGAILDFADEDDVPRAIEDLVDLVIYSIGGEDNWERDGVWIVEEEGMLIANHLPEVHERISEFLKLLEQNASRQLVCHLFELDKRTPVRETVTRQELAQLVEARVPLASFVIGDGQRNHHFHGTLRHFTNDAESVEHVIDPVVERLRTGLSLDVTPHVTMGGVLCNIRLARCTNPAAPLKQIMDERGEPLVSVELPKLRAQSTGDSRLIPTGGGAIYRIGNRVYCVGLEIVGGN